MEQTRHRWKLGLDAWADLVILGRLTAKRLAMLKRYLELVEPDPEPDEVTGLDGDGI